MATARFYTSHDEVDVCSLAINTNSDEGENSHQQLPDTPSIVTSAFWFPTNRVAGQKISTLRWYEVLRLVFTYKFWFGAPDNTDVNGVNWSKVYENLKNTMQQQQYEEDGLTIDVLKRWFLATQKGDYCITEQDLIAHLENADTNEDGKLTLDEFTNMMDHIEQEHFQCGDPSDRDTSYQKLASWQRAWKALAYAEVYSCLPIPPLLMVSLSLVQVIIFAVFGDSNNALAFFAPGERSEEVWRLVSYALAHDTLGHLLSNVTFQLLVGVPLEMTQQNPIRVATVFLLGIVAGAISSASWGMTKGQNLVGSSGGVYALLTAHVASIVLNWQEDSVLFRQRITARKPAKAVMAWNIRAARVLLLLILLFVDAGLTIHAKWASCPPQPGRWHCKTVTNYAAHVSGGTVGLLGGYVILKERKAKPICRKVTAGLIMLILGIVTIDRYVSLVLGHDAN